MLRQSAFFLVSMIVLLTSFVASERAFSPSFQVCISTDKNADKSSTSKKEPSSFGVTVTQYVRCTGRFIDSHGVGITALASIIIAAFTGTLWVATSRQATLTKIAAEAAKQSADALPAIERCYVFLRVTNSNIQLKPIDTPATWSPNISSLWVRFTFINYGRTPAIIQEIKVGIRRMDGDLPVDAWVEEDRLKLPLNVLGSGEFFEKGGFYVSDPAQITQADADLIFAGGLFVYFFGHVAYQDVFGNDRETQFCWRVSRERFHEWGGREHNYRT